MSAGVYKGKSLDQLLKDGMLIGYYDHPMNSVTACISHCFGLSSSTAFAYIKETQCGCLSASTGLLKYPITVGYVFYNLIDDFAEITIDDHDQSNCGVYTNCPGQPLQYCGCRTSYDEPENFPLVYQMESLGKLI